jgi:hypothetical protein
MRSTRVGGCTHSWVDETFLREQEKRNSSLRKEAIFAELGHTFRGKQASMHFKAKVQHLLQAVLYGFPAVRTTLILAQKSRRGTTLLQVVLYGFSAVRTTEKFWHRK